MIEVFVLIGWIDGYNSGGVIGQEFTSLETCETAKSLYVQNHDINDSWGQYNGSWVECVKK